MRFRGQPRVREYRLSSAGPRNPSLRSRLSLLDNKVDYATGRSPRVSLTLVVPGLPGRGLRPFKIKKHQGRRVDGPCHRRCAIRAAGSERRSRRSGGGMAEQTWPRQRLPARPTNGVASWARPLSALGRGSRIAQGDKRGLERIRRADPVLLARQYGDAQRSRCVVP